MTQQQPTQVSGLDLQTKPADAIERMSGAGRVLIAVYLVLAAAATFRSMYQILTKFDEAPIAYSLSAVAGVVYVVASIALMKRTGVWRTVAWASLIFELTGVLVVGTLSLLAPQWFAHPSVWSWFGAGYLGIPLVLPILGLTWLARERRALRAASGVTETAGHSMERREDTVR